MVTTQRRIAQEGIDKFREAFAQMDSTVQIGTTFSNAIAMLGKPRWISTNDEGTFAANYDYTPAVLGQIPIAWLTNGFRLFVSNGVIVDKAYTYMSSH